jgi:hypothetical protein
MKPKILGELKESVLHDLSIRQEISKNLVFHLNHFSDHVGEHIILNHLVRKKCSNF